VRVGATWYMYYSPTYDNNIFTIDLATSSNGLTWSVVGAVVSAAAPAFRAAYPHVLHKDGVFHMWYGSYDGVYRILHTTSPDGVAWAPGTLALDQEIVGDLAVWVWAPSVLFDGALFHMWYTVASSANLGGIYHATSTDGLIWARHGVVISPQVISGVLMSQTIMPAVVQEASGYVMWFSCSTGTAGHICRAKSADGVSWSQEGVVLSPDATDSTLNLFAADPTVVGLGDDAYRVWFHTRGTQSPVPGLFPGDEIWTGTTSSGEIILGFKVEGFIISVPIALGTGGRWRHFEARWAVPEGTAITISVLDVSLAPIPGFEARAKMRFSLREISPEAHPILHLRADFVGNPAIQPSLLIWAVL